MARVVVAEPIAAKALGRLRARHEVVELTEYSAAALDAALVGAEGLIVRTYSRVTADIISNAACLRVIARAGSGVENIDTSAASHSGITVVYRPAAATAAVADLTIGLIIALERRILAGGQEIDAGRFSEGRQQLVGRPLSSLTLGIIGCGRIGCCVADAFHRAFGAAVVHHDIRDVKPSVPSRALALTALLEEADVVSLHVPLTAKTRRLIDASALARMRPNALLINTARGAVIDAEAVATALHAGRLGGAAIDVFEPEPPPPNHPLRGAPRCILTPHIGARTAPALTAMSDVVDDVIAVLDGKPPEYPYTEEWS